MFFADSKFGFRSCTVGTCKMCTRTPFSAENEKSQSVERTAYPCCSGTSILNYEYKSRWPFWTFHSLSTQLNDDTLYLSSINSFVRQTKHFSWKNRDECNRRFILFCWFCNNTNSFWFIFYPQVISHSSNYILRI